MQQLAPLEDAIAKVHKDLPHLPKGLTKWLVENAWWLVIIGVALGVFAVLGTIATMLAGSLLVGALVGAAMGGALFLSSTISLLVMAATIVLEAMAIQPLKDKQKRGWNLLFLASLVGIAGGLVSLLVGAFVGGNPFGVVTGIFWTAVGAAISFYVLFELRVHYVGAKVATEPTVVPPKPTKDA